MSLQHENRDQHEVGNDSDKVDYQRFEHPDIDLLNFTERGSTSVNIGTQYPVSVRIYCPEIRVVSRIACLFQPKNPNDKSLYDLSTLSNTIVAYRCMNAGPRIARVGEIVGKNGIPMQFPKSDIDGIAFQNEDDMPWIDVDLSLAFPGVEGKWSMFYHATSNNKLKKLEWQGYITRVTMSVQSSPGTILFNGGV